MASMNLEGLGKRLKAAREAVTNPSVTQRDAGQLVNKSAAAIGHWELEKTVPELADLQILANAYNVDIAWLLGIESSKHVATSTHPMYIVPILPISALAKWRFYDAIGIVQSTIHYADAVAAAIKVESDAMGQLAQIGDIAILERHFSPEPEGVYMIQEGKSLVPVMRRLKSDGSRTLYMADDLRFPYVLSSDAKPIAKVSEIIHRSLL